MKPVVANAATGMAMKGLKPIVEIMFGDFISLAADQIINHATNIIGCTTIRLSSLNHSNSGWSQKGYGPTHSQSLENIFLSVPGLEIVSPSIP